MDVEQAQRVKPGDIVAFQKAARRVIAVSHDGLWAPYFDLDEDGMVSYLLVEDEARATTRAVPNVPGDVGTSDTGRTATSFRYYERSVARSWRRRGAQTS